MLNSRQWAGVAWLILLVGAVLASRTGRDAVTGVLRVLVQPAVLLVFLVYGAWIILEVYLGAHLGLWTRSLAAPTVLWSVLVGLPLLFSFTNAAEDPGFLAHRVREMVAAGFLVDIVVNIRTFHIIIEFLLQGFLGFVVMVSAIASTKSDYRNAKRIADGTLAVVGSILLLIGLTHLIENPQALLTITNLRSWLLPLWLGIGLIPLVVLLGMYSNIDRIFRMMSREEEKKLTRLRNIVPVIIRLGYRPSKASRCQNYWTRQLALAPSLRGAWNVVTEFKEYRRQKAQEAQDQADRLERYGGVEGTDNSGRQLDQREFEATRRALEDVHLYHDGWYDHEPAGYKEEKIEFIIENDEWSDLPADPEIKMEVRDDGQAWYAWRQTVTGWVLAIGATDGEYPPWYYDGPDPPEGFPGESDEWSRIPGESGVSRNWI